MVRIRAFTRFAGTLTIFCWVRNSIPIKVNSFVGIKSDFFRFDMKPRFFTTCIWKMYFVWDINRLWIRSLISQSSRYGKRDTACSGKCVAITFINFVKIHGLRDIPYLQCPQQVWHMLRTYADFRVNHCGSWRMSADVRYKSADVGASVKACGLLRTFFCISWGYLFADVRSSMQVSLQMSAKACVKFWLCFFFCCGLVRTFWT